MSRLVALLERLKAAYRILKNPVKMRLLLKSFNQNWAVRVLALLLALGAWAFVLQTKTKSELYIKAPLKFITAPDIVARAFAIDGSNRELTNINIKISCSQSNSKIFKDGDYEVEVALKGEIAGNIIPEYKIRKDKIHYIGQFPEIDKSDVVIDFFAPNKIRILTDITRRKLIPVLPKFIGLPKKGFEVVDKEVFPTAVMVQGPARLVDALTNVYTETINIEGMFKSLESDYDVVAPLANINVLKPNVRVKIGINTKPVYHVFRGVKVKQYGTPERGLNVAFSPATIDVTLEGQKDIIDLITSLEIKALVDVDNSPVGMSILPVKLILPPNCKLVESQPGVVTNYVGITKEQ